MKTYHQLQIRKHQNFAKNSLLTNNLILMDFQKEFNQRMKNKNPYKSIGKFSTNNKKIKDILEEIDNYFRMITYRERPVDTLMRAFDDIGFGIRKNEDQKFIICPASKYYEGEDLKEYTKDKVYETFKDIANDKYLTEYFENIDRNILKTNWDQYSELDFTFEEIDSLPIEVLQDKVLENMPKQPFLDISASYFFHHPDQKEFDKPEKAILTGDYNF